MQEKQKEKASKPNKERHAPSLKGHFIILVLLVSYILFNLLAAYIFVLIERERGHARAPTSINFAEVKRNFSNRHNGCLSDQDLEEFLKEVQLAIGEGVQVTGNVSWAPSTDEGKWSLHNAFLLAFTISSTIGYGVVTPVTAGGQLFCIVFAFLGIPFTGLLAAKIGFLMAYYIKKATSSICSRIPRAKTLSILFTSLIGAILYILLPSLLLTFVGNEEGWTFVQCLYCVIITLTTIGFGDLVPDPSSQGGMLTTVVVLVWVIAGLAWFATIVNLVATSMKKHAQKFSQKVIRPPLKKQTGKQNVAEEKGDKRKSSMTNRAEEGHEAECQTEVRKTHSSCSDACIQTEPVMLGPSGVQTVIVAHMDSE